MQTDAKEKLLPASLVDANPLENVVVEFLKKTGLILRGKVKEITAVDADPAS